MNAADQAAAASPPSISDDEFRERVAANIRRLREAKGLTCYRLGQLVGTRTSAITRIERGDNAPGGALLMRIAQALDVTAEQLAAPLAE